jgi:hypothetical protein
LNSRVEIVENLDADHLTTRYRMVLTSITYDSALTGENVVAKPSAMKQEDPEKLGKESAYEDETEMKRRVRRGDESEGDPDERDVAGDYADEPPENTDPASDQGLRGRRVPS